MKMTRLVVLTLALFAAAGATFAGDQPLDQTNVQKPDGLKFTIAGGRNVLPVGKQERMIMQVMLEAPRAEEGSQRSPVNLAIVLDCSKSMAGDRLKRAKKAVLETVKGLDKNDVFSLVAYGSNVKTVVRAQSAANFGAITKNVNALQAGGDTALFGGVSKGAAELRRNRGKQFVNRLILLTDGLANLGPSAPRDLERLGYSLGKEGISVSTIGIGLAFNEDLLTRLSQGSDGNSYFAEKNEQLSTIFREELRDLLAIPVRNVTLKVALKNGTRPLRLLGREGRIRRDQIQVRLNQLYAGRPMFILAEVQVAPGKNKEKRQLAEAILTYTASATGQERKHSRSLAISFGNSSKSYSEELNQSVQAEYNRLDNPNFFNKTVILMDQGKKQEAIGNLRQRAIYLRGQAVTQKNGSLEEQAESIDKIAVYLSTNGLSDRDRKIFVNEIFNYQQQLRIAVPDNTIETQIKQKNSSPIKGKVHRQQAK